MRGNIKEGLKAGSQKQERDFVAMVTATEPMEQKQEVALCTLTSTPELQTSSFLEGSKVEVPAD